MKNTNQKGAALRPRKNFRLTEEDRYAFRVASAALGDTGISLEEAVRGFLALGGKGVRGGPPVTVEKGVDDFMRAALRRGLREKTVQFYRQNLDGFVAEFGEKFLDAVRREDLLKWLRGFSVSSGLAHKRAVSALYGFGLSQIPAWATANPALKLPLAPVLKDRKIDFLSPGQAAAIMRQSPVRCRPALALMLFAGVRPEEIRGVGKPALSWECVDFKAREITIPADVAKTRTCRMLQNGLPENLWAWLAACPVGERKGEISPVRVGALRDFARAAACPRGGKWPHDAMRHSFASYHVAAGGNVGSTAEILGHGGNLEMLMRHYKGAARREDAAAYFEIFPEAKGGEVKGKVKVVARVRPCAPVRSAERNRRGKKE
jgi:integrase